MSELAGINTCIGKPAWCRHLHDDGIWYEGWWSRPCDCWSFDGRGLTGGKAGVKYTLHGRRLIITCSECGREFAKLKRVQ